MYLTISLLSLIGFMFVIEFSLYNPIFISVVVIISVAFSDITNFLSFWGLLKYHIVKIVKKIANDTKKIITDVNHYLKDTKKINLKNIFKNYSYLTGKNCNNKNELKYFE